VNKKAASTVQFAKCILLYAYSLIQLHVSAARAQAKTARTFGYKSRLRTIEPENP